MQETDHDIQMLNHRDEQISELFGELEGFLELKRMFGGYIHVGLADDVPTKQVCNHTGLSVKQIISRLDNIEKNQALLEELFYY